MIAKSTHLLIVSIILMAFGIAFSSLAYAAGYDPWPTTQFQVFPGNPVRVRDEDAIIPDEYLDMRDFFLDVNPDAIEELELALHEAAQWYKKNHFPAPRLEPLVQTENGLAYRVYLCTNDQSFKNRLGMYRYCTKRGAYAGLCANEKQGDSSTLYVNAGLGNFVNDKMTWQAYQTAAHELFHAIQATTAFRHSPNTCGIKKWIGEGMADAIAFDIADELWKGRAAKPSDTASVIKEYGYRPYSEPLAIPTSTACVPDGSMIGSGCTPATVDYTSSSFWRYLSDAQGSKDYAYLRSSTDGKPGVMDLELGPGNTWEREADWLNQGLLANFNLTLGQLYHLFVNSFADRRIPLPSRLSSELEKQKDWLAKLFGPCEEVTLNPAQPHAVISLQLLPLSALCVWVDFDFGGVVNVTFQSADVDQQKMKDISVGRAGTTLMVRAEPMGKTPTSPPIYIAKWSDWPVNTEEPRVFIVSNTAKKPSNTVTRQIEFTVSLPQNNNNFLAKTEPKPPHDLTPKPVGKRNTVALRKQREKTAKMVKEELEAGLDTDNPNTSGGIEVTRRMNERPCEEPFRFVACGPRIAISLEVRPGGLATAGHATADGGALAQLMGQFQAMAAIGSNKGAQGLEDAAKRISALDGNSVGIVIPMIDYGFTGTFNNAHLSVAMGDGNVYQAIGPEDGKPGPEVAFPLSGTVTIEEYTPMVMRGTFSGDLVRPEMITTPDPVLPVLHQVSGSFQAVSPWIKDARIERIIVSDQDDLVRDMASALGLDASKLTGLASSNAQSSSNQSPSKTGGGQLGCDCSCNYINIKRPACDKQCEASYAACRGADPGNALVEDETAGGYPELEGVDDCYSAALLKREKDQRIVDAYMDMVRGLPRDFQIQKAEVEFGCVFK